MNRFLYILLGLLLIATGVYQSYLFNEIQFTLIAKGLFNWMGSDFFIRLSASLSIALGTLLILGYKTRWMLILSMVLLILGFYADIFLSSVLFRTPFLTDTRDLSLLWMWIIPLVFLFPPKLKKAKWWLVVISIFLGAGTHSLLAPPYFQDYQRQNTYDKVKMPKEKIAVILDKAPSLKKGKTLLVFVSTTCHECQNVVDKINASMLGNGDDKRTKKDRVKVIYYKVQFMNRPVPNFEYPPISTAGEVIMPYRDILNSLPEGASTPALYYINNGKIEDFVTGWYINKPFLDRVFFD